ncbi:hypothetical protein [Hydrogenophaga borbori]|uniref:hypothetical protein n=1 Tax=Hydrogenophaga borbori TaxID=2294117 RepID=UPI001C6E2D82|nr:hypothetical protein [Hydrogenophaga borbori]
MFQRITIVAACLAATGCATVVNESIQPVKIETKTAAGELVAGAHCKLTNDRENVSVKSGGTAEVRRSASDLDIVCSHPGNPDASARAVSRANSGMFGNIIVGGAIGAIIDHNKGTAYTYPTWIQLVFGKVMVFDRNSEKDGGPVAGEVAGAITTSTAGSDAQPGAPANTAANANRPVTLDDLSGLLPAQR